MVVKFGPDPDDIYLLEAANGVGVFLQTFQETKECYGATDDHYRMMAWRKLNFERTEK